jgi:hypothetical protein
MTRILATEYKNCFQFHGPLEKEWHRGYWSMRRQDGGAIITLRTDNNEFNWRDQTINCDPEPLDTPKCWQMSKAGHDYIERCKESMESGVPARIILREREEDAKDVRVDTRFYWGIITHVGIGKEYGYIRGHVLPIDGYDPVSKTFKGK